MDRELLEAIADCHGGIVDMLSLDFLSDEYVEMLDKVFIPLLEGVKKGGMDSAVGEHERNALVSFFLDLSDKVDSESEMTHKRKMELETIIDKFERHVLSFFCAAAKNGKDIDVALMSHPSYLDAVKFILKRKQSRVIAELQETMKNGAKEHVILKKVLERIDSERNIKTEVARKKEYFAAAGFSDIPVNKRN